MRNTILTLIVAMVVSLSSATDAEAAGRESILARLNSPFSTFDYSRFTVNPYGLPARQIGAPLAEASAAVPTPLIAVEGIDQPAAAETPVVETLETPAFTPLAVGSPRPPYRPRVRSPFRPPPRPSF